MKWQSRRPDRNDVLFRIAAFAVAAMSLWLVVVIVVRNVPAGVTALAVGIIAGVAVALAVPERAEAVPKHADRGAPAPPPTTGPGAATGEPQREPVTVGASATGPDGYGQPARVPAVQASPPSGSRPDAVADGYVLGAGSSAGRAPWHLPVRAGQPGIAVDAMRLGDLEVRAASVIGPAHRCREPAVPRQDAYLLGRDARGEHLVVAVADGVSSSAHSELAARVAVSTATRELVAALDQCGGPDAIDVGGLFTIVAREITGTGGNRGVAAHDLCCLLVVAVVPACPAADGSRRVWTAQLGDVSVWTHGPAWQQRVGHPKSGLDRNKVETVLPFHPAHAVGTTVVVPPGHGVAVLTDGVGDLLTDVAGAAPFFAGRWATPPHPASFLADLCVDAPGQDDDRTAVVVWCGLAAPRARGPR